MLSLPLKKELKDEDFGAFETAHEQIFIFFHPFVIL
jgi:hypothetical protein